MRRWIAQTVSSYVAPGGVHLRANRSRRQIAMTAPVTQQEAGGDQSRSTSPLLGRGRGLAAGPWLGGALFEYRSRTGWRRPIPGRAHACRDVTLTPRRRQPTDGSSARSLREHRRGIRNKTEDKHLTRPFRKSYRHTYTNLRRKLTSWAHAPTARRPPLAPLPGSTARPRTYGTGSSYVAPGGRNRGRRLV